jgi:hypothetical protein
MEVSGNPDDPDSSAAEVVNVMSKSGYRIYHLDPTSGYRSSNYFFLRTEHIRRLTAILS